MPPLRRSALSALPTLLSLTKLVHVVPNQSTWSSSALAASGPPPIEPEDPPDSPAFWWKLGLSVVFVLSGGVFAGLTLALMGSDDLNLRVLSQSSSDPKERKSANKVLRLLSRGRHWVLVVLLLSNVIVNESLPIFLDDVLGGGLYAVIVSTTMIVIFGEIIPQAICVRYGLAIGGACAPMVWFFMILFSPIAWPTAKLLDYVLGTDEGHTYKKAELKSFLQFHREGEEPLRDDEIAILNGVLSLNEKHAKEIMTPIKDCLTLPADKVLDHEAIDHILLSGFSRIPVHEPGQQDNFVGMLLVKRLITYNPDDEWPVSKFSLLPLPEAKPDINCFQALDYFQTGRAHLLLISETPGQKGGALGIVSLEDLIEEIIGEEIVDETDRYEDNHSKKVVKRSGPAAVMRGIIERRRVINAFSRRPSRSSTFPTVAQTPGLNGGPANGGNGATATATNTTDGILVQIDNGNLVAEPVGFSGAPNDAEGGQESVTVDTSNRLVIGPDVLNSLNGANGNDGDNKEDKDKSDKPSDLTVPQPAGGMSPIAETSPTEATTAEDRGKTESSESNTNDLLDVQDATAGSGSVSKEEVSGDGHATADLNLNGSADTSANGSGTSTPREGEGEDSNETQALLGGNSSGAGNGSTGSGSGGGKKKKKGKKGKKDRKRNNGALRIRASDDDDDDDDEPIRQADSLAATPPSGQSDGQGDGQINLERPFESHEGFEAACKRFIHEYSYIQNHPDRHRGRDRDRDQDDENLRRQSGEGTVAPTQTQTQTRTRAQSSARAEKAEGRTNTGWEWREYKNIPHSGYMYRRVIRWLDYSLPDAQFEPESQSHYEQRAALWGKDDRSGRVTGTIRGGGSGSSKSEVEEEEEQEQDEEEEMMEEEEDEATALLIPPQSASAQGLKPSTQITTAITDTVPGISPRSGRKRKRVDVEQYIVRSKTHGTAMFCFRAWDETGAPLPIAQLLQLSFLRTTPDIRPTNTPSPGMMMPGRGGGGGLSTDADFPFPLIQSREHPSTGELVFSINPSRISEAVAGILQVELGGMWERAVDNVEEEEEKDKVVWEGFTWLQVFMMLTHEVVDLTYP